MNVKLVADSSANVRELANASYAYAPLKIVTDQREFVDDDTLDPQDMLKHLREHKGKSGTACPSVSEWIDAFGGAQEVLGVTITSNLSGCYNSASIAAQEYMAANPDSKVFILDSLSTGPEMELILEKYQELLNAGKTFDEICEAIQEYAKHTHLWFFLSSLNNLAKNGRVSPAVAAAAGILGIRVVGRASDVGTLEPMHKCRGEKKALRQVYTSMVETGFKGGKVRLSHSCNQEIAEKMAAMIREHYPDCDIRIRCNTGLCCFYAEEGSLLVGFEH